MKTEAYERIQVKLQEFGRNYFEGLNDSDFVGLTEDERSDIKQTLLERSRQGDGVSLDALKHLLLKEELLAFADALLKEEGLSDLFSAQLVTIILSIATDDNTWKQVITFLRRADASGRRWILNKISVGAIPDSARYELAETIAMILLRESDASLLLGEAVMLLLLRGFLPKSEPFITMAKRLQSIKQADRLVALEELGFSVQ